MDREGTIGPVWHGHHNRLLSFVDCDRRHTEINFKPAPERAKRHGMLRKVAAALPEEVIQAWTAYEQAQHTLAEAWGAAERARGAAEKAQMAYQRACERHRPAIEALHAAECGCGQAWDGEMVFP